MRMRRTIKLGLLASAAMLAFTGTATAQTTAAPHPAAEEAAYFQVDYAGMYDSDWVVKLTKPQDIQHARDLLSGATNEQPHVVGRLSKSPAGYNPKWSYHLRPDTISFFDAAIEVCDATPRYVEDHLDEAGGAFLPGLYWCPWGSRLVEEVPQP